MLLVAAVVSITADSRQTHAQGAVVVAPDSVQEFVKAALADRLRANDIPDLKVLDSSRPIGIRDVMPEAGERLESAAVPAVGSYRFFLLSPADAQAAADRDSTPVAFLTVDRPIISGDSATIVIGVDLTLPRTSHQVKLCCCTGSAEFQRTDRGWTFVKWSGMVCS